MQKQGCKKWLGLALVGLLVLGKVPLAGATTTTRSDHFEVSEMQFGSGSTVESCSGSGQYCARVSIGQATSGGESTSASHRASFGPVTPDEPMLEMIVDPGPSDLGELTTERTATKITTVRVRNYLSSGYTLQLVGDPPKYNNHTFAAPSSPTASAKGTEQFAINLVANSDPEIGEDPEQLPSSQTSFGQVEPSYSTPNQFMYQSGDTIARSYRESGRTDYTISMIVNISNNTPAGDFSGEFSAVVIPVF